MIYFLNSLGIILRTLTILRVKTPTKPSLKYNCKKLYFFMIHKIQYFEAEQLPEGVYLQKVVNDFLAEKGENIIAVHPVLGTSLLVHYKE